MSDVIDAWDTLIKIQAEQSLSSENVHKIETLLSSNDIEDIRNGMTVLTTLSSAHLCRYLKLVDHGVDQSIQLNTRPDWSNVSKLATVMMENIKEQCAQKGELGALWTTLNEKGAFDMLKFRALDDTAEGESDKELCVRISKEMVRVPAGSFMMGALADDEHAEEDEKPRHKVTLTRDLLVCKYPVTNGWYCAVKDFWTADFKRPNSPVTQLLWFKMIQFCNECSRLEGLEPVYVIEDVGEDKSFDEDLDKNGYRVPTEAEWEYLARGGEEHLYAGSNDIDEVVYSHLDSPEMYQVVNPNFINCKEPKPFPVGLRKPNGFGLYDMTGNVRELCWDFWSYQTHQYTSEAVTDPTTGIDEQGSPIYRGGDYWCHPKDLRVSV